MSKFRFKNLDSIRTIAFLSVFLVHAVSSKLPAVCNSQSYSFFVFFRELFDFGVPIFFVLSGFLISFLMLKEQESENGFSVKNFYMRRVLRIWPVYYLVIVFGFFVFPLLRNHFLHLPYIENAHFVNYLLFLSNFDQINNHQWPFGVGLGPTWSVGVEEQFYLLWPIVIMIFKKRKFIIPIAGFLIISTISSIVLNLNIHHTLFCFMYLSTGALFAYLSFYYKEHIKKITNINPFFFLLTIAVIMLSIMGVINIFGPFRMIIISLLIGFLIVYQCYSGRFAFENIPFIERMGKYTYGLYLYHSICIFIAHTFVLDILKVEETPLSVVLIIPLISLILSVIVSVLSYKYYESFFLNLKDKFSND